MFDMSRFLQHLILSICAVCFYFVSSRVLVGYGLTETSPVIANRVACENTKGTTGKPVPGSEVKIADLESGEQVRRRCHTTAVHDAAAAMLWIKLDSIMSVTAAQSNE